jgi:hypothetical protein
MGLKEMSQQDWLKLRDLLQALDALIEDFQDF